VTGVGDVNGDNTADVLVGAADADVDDEEGAGRAYLLSGSDGSLLRTYESPRPESGAEFGGSVATLGDADGDGTPDLAVGAWRDPVGTVSSAGRVYLFGASHPNP
jgi:hypothetical protein